MDIFDLSRLKSPLAVFLVGLLLGLVGDLLLYGMPAGISFPILVTLIVAALLGLAFYEDMPVTAGNLWLVAPLFFLAVMSVVRAAPFPRFLNFSGSILLMLLLVNRLGARPVVKLNLGQYFGALLESALLSSLFSLPVLIGGYQALRHTDTKAGPTLRRLALGLAIAAPFLLIFTALFASADLLFNKYLTDILDRFNAPDLFGHTFFTIFLAWFFVGGLAYALTRLPGLPGIFQLSMPGKAAGEENGEPVANSDIDDDAAPRRPGWLGIVESSVVLFSIDVLFAAFVGVQFAALFGGEAFLESQGLTYSTYARTGFFQLLAVAIITQLLILVLEYITHLETRGQSVIFLVGSALMIAMTLIILASAFNRLSLYEQAYGFTRLRVHSRVLMVWIGILLAAFLSLLSLGKTRYFATAAMVAAIGFTVTLDVLNPDVFILKKNLARYDAGEALDVGYIGSLSADAAPHLIPLLYEYEPEIGQAAGPWLRYQLNELDRRQADAGWPSYHLSYNRAYRALNLNRELIEQFDVLDRYEIIDVIPDSR